MPFYLSFGLAVYVWFGLITVITLIHVRPLQSELIETIVLLILTTAFWPSVLWELYIERANKT